MNNTKSQETVKHTPGPWTFDGMWSLIMAGKYEIAAVHAARTIDETNKRKRLDEANANARLISAAPDLLEACKLVERAHVGDGVQMSTAVDACLLAIEKASAQ